MANPELIQSWAKSEALFREAGAALPAEVAVAFRRDLEHVDDPRCAASKKTKPLEVVEELEPRLTKLTAIRDASRSAAGSSRPPSR